jgi:antitoxin ParD1/3/4
MNAITLPPDLERFADEAVAAGRYQDIADVVRAGVALLRRMEAERARLLASVLAAEEEADRDGYLSADEMVERVEARLARRHGAPA